MDKTAGNLKWLLRWHDGKVPDPRNLVRAATRNKIESPLELSRDEVEVRLVGCIGELFRLKKEAPELRRKHLRWRLLLARQRRDDKACQEILRIIRKEADFHRQSRINKAVKPMAGRTITSVQVETSQGAITFSKKKKVISVCSKKIAKRYQLGARAPINMGQMAEDFGKLRDTEAARRLLDDDYKFPPDCDQATIDLLREAAKLRLEFDKVLPAESDTTVDDFVGFRATAGKRTGSSMSDRHFAHYHAACGDMDIVRIHVRNINLAARHGMPLKRWKNGVTALLEKVMGNILIDKLHAICLLEADFNWWLKIIYARRMMHRM